MVRGHPCTRDKFWCGARRRQATVRNITTNRSFTPKKYLPAPAPHVIPLMTPSSRDTLQNFALAPAWLAYAIYMVMIEKDCHNI